MDKKCRVLYGLEAADAGALKHLLYLVLKLDRNLFEITVILSEKRSARVHSAIEKMRRAGARVFLLSMGREIRPWQDLQAMLAIFHHLRANRYDVVHAHSSKAGILFRLAAWLSGVKTIVYTPHCFYFQSKKGIKKWLFAGIERLMSVFTHHIVVSNGEKNSALRHGIAGPGMLKSINNAINFDDYSYPSGQVAGRSAIRAQLGIGENTIVVGAVGRLALQKDWETFIYAAAETTRLYSNAVFLIVGDGELMDDLKSLIHRLGLTEKVIIAGFREDIAQMFSVIDIYVSTSLWEGLPYVLLEAMWFKKPVIATDLDYGDIIQDNENGYLVACRDYRLIASKIGHLIKNEQLGSEMGRKGYLIAERCLSFKTFVSRHEELYLAA
jgi:glycosyltransferase involved in cell wall biosynthesis